MKRRYRMSSWSATILLVLPLIAPGTANRAIAAEESGRVLAPGDLIAVRLPEFTEPNQPVTFEEHVGENGAVPLPLVGDVKVGGMNVADAGHAVDKAFADAKLIQHARARVTLTKAGGKPLPPLAPGDRVRVRMWDLDGPGKVTALDATLAKDGTISVPRVGRAKLGGMTESQAVDSLVSLYAKADLIAHLPVTVTRLDAPATKS